MGMNMELATDIDDADSKSSSPLNGENNTTEAVVLEILARLDVDLAYSSEKLMNLDLFMAIVSLLENELGEFSLGNDKISESEIEKALMFDLSFGYLDTEVMELGRFLNALRTIIIDVHQKVYSCRRRREVSNSLQEKLRFSENSWKHLLEQVSELKKQLSNLSGSLSFISQSGTKSLEDEDLERFGFNMQTDEQQRHVLRMLEKSLAAELDLEKQLLASKEREQKLKLKLLHTNDLISNFEAFSEVALERLLEAQNSAGIYMEIVKEIICRLEILQSNLRCSVQREAELKSTLLLKTEIVSNIEAFSEVALERLLETEFSSEIFMGIAKEMMSRLQILQFSLHCSVQREEELKSKLLRTNEVVSEMEAFSEVALERLLVAEHSSEIYIGAAKEMISRLQILQFNLKCSSQREEELKVKVQDSLEQLKEKINQNSQEKVSLERKILLLEENLQSLETKLQERNALCGSNTEEISVMKHEIEFLKEHVSIVESRAHSAEALSDEALERLLVTEHSSETYLGIAKEMISRLQVLQFNLNCTNRREEELKSRLQGSLEQLMESKNAKVNQVAQEKETMECQLKALEEKLQSAEMKLRETNASHDASREQMTVMEDEIESLREHVLVAESRAHDAEEKIAALSEENIELREEVGFLKSGDGNEQKISLLEKQVRELEFQAQNAKMSSEASQEQQNMLYCAIWDMETLIEELKSKVSKAESRAESAEEQCLLLAEKNLELGKEMGCLKSAKETLHRRLKEANEEKMKMAKDINTGAKVITEMVRQLAVERDRIQKQMSSLARENRILLEELRKMRKNGAKGMQETKENGGKEFGSSVEEAAIGVSRMTSVAQEAVETPSSAAASNQGDEPSEQDMIHEAETAGSSTVNDADASHPVDDLDDQNAGEDKIPAGKKRSHTYFLIAILSLLLSLLAMNVNWDNISCIVRHQYLGFL